MVRRLQIRVDARRRLVRLIRQMVGLVARALLERVVVVEAAEGAAQTHSPYDSRCTRVLRTRRVRVADWCRTTTTQTRCARCPRRQTRRRRRDLSKRSTASPVSHRVVRCPSSRRHVRACQCWLSAAKTPTVRVSSRDRATGVFDSCVLGLPRCRQNPFSVIRIPRANVRASILRW